MIVCGFKWEAGASFRWNGNAGAAPATVSEVKDLYDATVREHGKAQIQVCPHGRPLASPETSQ